MNMESVIESLLFISGEPISFKKLSKIVEKNEKEIKSSAETLSEKYRNAGGGLRILVKDNKVQIVTAGENSKYVEKFLKTDIEGELSKASLETVSIVAYRGPISRAEIEQIRGVNCSFTLRHLMIRGLIERVNKPDDARAYLYRISFDFLKKLGVERAEDLPDYSELRQKKILSEEKNEFKHYDKAETDQ